MGRADRIAQGVCERRVRINGDLVQSRLPETDRLLTQALHVGQWTQGRTTRLLPFGVTIDADRDRQTRVGGQRARKAQHAALPSAAAVLRRGGR